MRLGIVDYGMCNILNVARAFEFCGAAPEILTHPQQILEVDAVVLPGVGAFNGAMIELRRRGFVEALQTSVANGRPLLGICLGMQLLLDRSEEFGASDGLGFISGSVKRIPGQVDKSLKVPHTGWGKLQVRPAGDVGLDLEGSFYFVHSYMAVLEDDSNCLASCQYGEIDIVSVVKKAHVTGFQFHPEKSGVSGLNLIKSYMESI